MFAYVVTFWTADNGRQFVEVASLEAAHSLADVLREDGVASRCIHIMQVAQGCTGCGDSSPQEVINRD